MSVISSPPKVSPLDNIIMVLETLDQHTPLLKASDLSDVSALSGPLIPMFPKPCIVRRRSSITNHARPSPCNCLPPLNPRRVSAPSTFTLSYQRPRATSVYFAEPNKAEGILVDSEHVRGRSQIRVKSNSRRISDADGPCGFRGLVLQYIGRARAQREVEVEVPSKSSPRGNLRRSLTPHITVVL